MSEKRLISEFMTKAPHSIEPHQTLAFAKKRMHELSCRHLPVRSAAQLIGIISERDLIFLETFEGLNMDKAQVVEAMVDEPYSVLSDTPVAEAAAKMAHEKFGSVLVQDSTGDLVGIFTHTDALMALAELA